MTEHEHRKAMEAFKRHYDRMQELIQEMHEGGYIYPIDIDLSPFNSSKQYIHVSDNGDKGDFEFVKKGKPQGRWERFVSEVDGVPVFYLAADKEEPND